MKKLILNIYNFDFFRYCVIGIFNTICGLSLIFFFYHVVGINYLIANIFTYAIVLCFVFLFHDRWVFSKSTRKLNQKALRFVFIFFISFLNNLLLLYLSVEHFAVHPDVGQIIGIIGYSTTNYFGNKFITFKKL